LGYDQLSVAPAVPVPLTEVAPFACCASSEPPPFVVKVCAPPATDGSVLPARLADWLGFAGV
jgi:hypothetical protein